MKIVSLGTSKVNYIDPLIAISFMIKHDIEWAKEVDENFNF